MHPVKSNRRQFLSRTTGLLVAGGLSGPAVADRQLGLTNRKAPTAPELRSRAVVFNYQETDPYDPGNRYGFNHAPSVTCLANGDLLCAWFSGPYEGAVNQVILAARSHDEGATWEKAFV